MKRFKDLPWEKKEKLYIIVLIISIVTNILCAACLIYIYKVISDCMTIII